MDGVGSLGLYSRAGWLISRRRGDSTRFCKGRERVSGLLDSLGPCSRCLAKGGIGLSRGGLYESPPRPGRNSGRRPPVFSSLLREPDRISFGWWTLSG